MTVVLWLLPTLTVLLAIASGRLATAPAAFLGLGVAIPIAMLTGPWTFEVPQLLLALQRGTWIGLTIAPYILGGLLFWQVAMPASAENAKPSASVSDATDAAGHHTAERRRHLFFACFLVGPFAESATGFGVGMLGTLALLRGWGLAPRQLMVFGLMSQTLIPWGGMGSGTMLAAAYARMPAAELGLYAMVPAALLMLVWLPLFWRTAHAAGCGAGWRESAYEALWLTCALGMLGLATAYLGPETALLAAYGPLIVLRYLIDHRPGRQALQHTIRTVLPYALLIAGLMMSRLHPDLKALLWTWGQVAPFRDLPVWSPLFHAGSWLLIGALLAAVLMGRIQQLSALARATWHTGKPSVGAVFGFAMLAEVLAGAGIAQAFATGLFQAWQGSAVLMTPWIAGVFGILTNSGNAPNSLFMPSQLALALQAGLSVPAVVALQHVSGTSMSLFSPVRMALAAGLSGGQGMERSLYWHLLPYALLGFTLLSAMALGILWVV